MANEESPTVLRSVHDAQAFEDARLGSLSLRESPPMPLESRREETEKETWDDAVSLEEISQASRTLASLSLSGTGSATCLAVDSKLIFVGMSDGSVLLLDHFGVTRGTFESIQGGQATALDSFQNTLVVVGYEDGRVVLWDASNPTKLLDVSAPTGVPVSTVRWYRGGVSCIAIDAMGVANLFKFSKTFLISSYTADRKLLLDGRTKHGFGPVFAAKVVLTDTSVGLALTVSTFTLLVRLEPEPTRIVHRWESTALVSIQSQEAIDANERIPCLAFHPAAFLAHNRYQCPVLVRCLGRTIEFACLDQMLEMVSAVESTYIPSAPVVACEWISDCCVSFLDGNYQFQMLDTQSQLIVGRCDATRVQLVRWYLPSHPDIGTYENSIRPLRWMDEINASLYLLGVGELVKVGIQPWSVRVDRLVRSGQWLEAMTLSLKYYRTVLLPLESGEDDRLKTAGLMSAIRDGSKISDLLKNYLRFHSDSLSADVGAVCIEYAISINRFDLIFEDVFEAFMERDKTFELMAVLNPFVLAGKIPVSPPPVVFDSLIQYVSSNCSRESLETLFLSLKQVPFDLDGPIRMCKEKQLLTAMCRLYTEGLGDFVTPVQVALGWIIKAKQVNEEMFRSFGYRLLLFMSYCFLGMEFPRGNVPLPQDKAELARVTLLSFFFPPHAVLLSSAEAMINESLNEPLFTLLDFDTGAFLKVLEQASGFEEEREILRWLAVAETRLVQQRSTLVENEEKSRRQQRGGGGARWPLLNFLVRHVTHVRRRPVDGSGDDGNDGLAEVLSPHLAQAFFRDVCIELSSESSPSSDLPKLVEDMIERYPRDHDWYLEITQSLAPPSSSPAMKHITTVLRRLKLRQTPSEAAFTAALEAYLQLDSSEQVLEFIRESKDKYGTYDWFSSGVGARARDLLATGNPLAPKLLFEVSADVSALMRDLEGDPGSQFALLKPLVGARAFGEEVTLEMVERFIRLMCEREPHQAYEWFAKNEGRYPLDAALEACRSRNIEDATAYLLERAGKVEDALGLVLRSVRGLSEYDGVDRRSRLEHSATVAINLCVNISQSSPQKSDMWFRVLDTFMDLPSSLVDANGGDLIALIVRIVDAMMPYVQLDKILERIKQLDGGEERFRPAVMGMLESFKREVSMYRVTSRSLTQDIVFVEQRKRLSRVKGTRVKASAMATSQIAFVPVPSPPASAFGTTMRSDSSLKAGGDDQYDSLEKCWDALQDGDAHRLAHNLLIGTKYELQLAPPPMGHRAAVVPELMDAGI